MFLVVPFVVAVMIGTTAVLLRGWGAMTGQWAQTWPVAAAGSSMIALFCGAALGGNAFAGERGDRSAEFTATLPVSRRLVLASKAIHSAGLTLAIVMVTLLVLTMVNIAETQRREISWNALFGFTAVAVMTCGIAWALSTITDMPGIAAGGGLASLVAMLVVVLFTEYLNEPPGEAPLYVIFGACLIVGLAAFILGTVHYLRRIGP